jgi:fumarate hydratase class II
MQLLSRRMTRVLADKALAGLQVRGHHDAALERNPILVTALNPVIGYEQAAKIAKRGGRCDRRWWLSTGCRAEHACKARE